MAVAWELVNCPVSGVGFDVLTGSGCILGREAGVMLDLVMGRGL